MRHDRGRVERGCSRDSSDSPHTPHLRNDGDAIGIAVCQQSGNMIRRPRKDSHLRGAVKLRTHRQGQRLFFLLFLVSFPLLRLLGWLGGKDPHPIS